MESKGPIERLEEKVFDLTVQISVLQKMMDQCLGALAQAKVAEKTADKALAMAQEALVIVTSSNKIDDTGFTPSKFQNDLALSDQLEKAEDESN